MFPLFLTNMNDIKPMEEDVCSDLSDFVSAFSVDLQESFTTAEDCSLSSCAEHSCHFLGEENRKSEKNIVEETSSDKNSDRLEREDEKVLSLSSKCRPSLFQVMSIFLVMLVILSISLLIVCSQVTLPCNTIRPQAIPIVFKEDQLAILPNGNLVKIVGAKFKAPVTGLQILNYLQITDNKRNS